MKNTNKRMLTTLNLILMVSLVFFGCAKKEVYDEVHKEPELVAIGAAFEMNGDYLYVPSTLGMPREVSSTRAFWQGDEKVVRLKFSEEGLNVYERDHDDRFNNNPINNSPLLTIPGKFQAFRCSENSQNECTNREEENTEIEWDQKTHFLPDFESLKTYGFNMIKYGVDGDCVALKNTRLVNYELSKGVINVELEKEYELNDSWDCLKFYYYNDKLKSTSFKSRFFYSLVKLDQVASKDYKPQPYPITEHSKFGFFKSEYNKLNDHFTGTDKHYLMNRWNPARKTITYYMSETFNKKKNKIIKDATYKTFESMNKGLAEANVNFRLVLKEPKKGIRPGDIRHSMIVLIDEPLDAGLLGYGPTITNPKTGEILQAHTNMYSAALESMSQRIWENMVDLFAEKPGTSGATSRTAGNNSRSSHPSEENVSHSGHDHGNHDHSPSKLIKELAKSQKIMDLKKVMPKTKVQKLSKLKLENLKSYLKSKEALVENAIESRLQLKEDPRAHEVKKMSYLEKKLAHKKDRLNLLAENNAYAEEFFNLDKSVDILFPGLEKIAGAKNKDGSLKSWTKLSKAQRKAAVKIMLPYVYSSTLVHEVGHNLGLRHNFAGSFDPENFFTDKEVKEKNLNFVPQSSSTMDYAGSNFGELSVYGNYDIAALRYGYARQIEAKNGEIIGLKGTLTEHLNKLKPLRKQLSDLEGNQDSEEMAISLKAQLSTEDPRDFKFCTDGNAGLSVTCNRFDSGSNLVELTEGMIRKYKNLYRRRNFRYVRNSFGTLNLDDYVMARFSEFNKIRSVFEEWESYSFLSEGLLYSGCPDDAHWICKGLNDRIKAVKLVGKFFLEVLKTPDHLCATVAETDTSKIAKMVPLAEIYESIKRDIDYVPTSCFDPAVVKHLKENKEEQLNEEGKKISVDVPLIPAAEAGKFLNSFKDADQRFNRYTSDRYALGVWVDKIMAMKSLTQRTSGMKSNSGYKNFLDHKEISVEVNNFLDHITLGTPLNGLVPFKFEDKKTITLPYSIGLDYKIEGNDIQYQWINDFFKIPEGNSSLIQVLLRNAKKFEMQLGTEITKDSRKNTNKFTVRKEDIGANVSSERIQYLTLDNDILYGATEANPIAFEMISTFTFAPFLKSVEEKSPGKIKELYENRVNPKLSEEYSEAQQATITISVDYLSQLIDLAKGQEQDQDPSNDGVFTPEMIKRFNASFGPELTAKFILAISLKSEGLKEILDLKNKFMNDAPELADPDTVKVYEVPLHIHKSFTEGTLDAKVERYSKILPLLPTHVSAELD